MTPTKIIIRQLKAKEISEILFSGDFNKFIGVRENEFFEAKPIKPYNLEGNDNIEKIQAIAKISTKVAGFANQQGGYIVCGLDTPPIKDVPHDVVSALNLAKKSDFYNEALVYRIIHSSIYPQLEVKVGWYASSDNPTLGLGVIHIPKQDEKRKYFIVRVCEIDGRTFKGFLGIPIRKDDQTNWSSDKEVYKLSKRTPNNWQELDQSISEQLQGIETRLSSKIENSSRELQPKTEDLLELKIEKALNE